ncbi:MULTISPECIES: hypothetical protein [Pseudomonas]|nr:MULTISPECIES: hypothetical protein [Pseudomonas]
MAIVLMFRIDIQLVALRVTSFCYWLYAEEFIWAVVLLCLVRSHEESY